MFGIKVQQLREIWRRVERIAARDIRCRISSPNSPSTCIEISNTVKHMSVQTSLVDAAWIIPIIGLGDQLGFQILSTQQRHAKRGQSRNEVLHVLKQCQSAMMASSACPARSARPTFMAITSSDGWLKAQET